MEFRTDRRKFRINPMEIVIFAAVALVFVKSAIALFSRPGLDPVALQVMNADPTHEAPAPGLTTETRGLAEVTARETADLQLDCDSAPEQQTTAARVRLRGMLCRATGAGAGSHDLSRAVIVNQTNHSTATVFTDLDEGKFATDYIPLGTGKNVIHVEFAYDDGKAVTRDFNVTRN